MRALVAKVSAEDIAADIAARAQEGYVFDASDLNCSATLVILVKEIADHCESTYPGWGWIVQPDERGGVIYLRALMLHGTWGYTMLIRDLQNDPRLEVAKRGAGEILERFGMPRGAYDRDRWRQIPRDVAGNCVPDISDKELANRKRARDEALNIAIRGGRAQFETLKDMDGRTHVVLRHDSNVKT